MNIFITGITGFVGSSLVTHFESKNDCTVFGNSRDEAVAKKKFANLPVSIQPGYSTALSDELGIETVVHLAGIAHDLSNQYTAEDYENVNVGNTKRVFDSFLESSASKFIFLSSIKAAVDTTDEPVGENVVPAPVTDYGKSKLRAEADILSKPLPAGKFVYILRPAMIHGPGNKGNLNLLYKFVKWGIPWPLGKFENQRSFLSIDNFTFIIDCLLRENVPPGIYHLADTGYISTTELVNQIGSSMSKRVVVWNFPTAMVKSLAMVAGQQSRLSKLTENMMVSNEKLLSVLGKPLPVTLQEGIAKTIQSFRK
ncbi:MAG TPA: NAD-dependent epimerase/dehydratase family protein [Cyclobacteriaceae bacterium]|jgi:nucleoside-diphosphate-sugar epimerase|nr:NAD-dependent epimerase/dehydratase family protein [Cyclobacteriaceae bacterium]